VVAAAFLAIAYQNLVHRGFGDTWFVGLFGVGMMALNQMAAEGWRLVASNVSPIGTSGWTLIFERQVQP
jgi:hypothetical protein